jgi:hypothetical protein
MRVFLSLTSPKRLGTVEAPSNIPTLCNLHAEPTKAGFRACNTICVGQDLDKFTFSWGIMLKLTTICHEGVRLTSGDLLYTETCFLLLRPMPFIKIRQR